MARMIDIGGSSGEILNFEGSHIAFMLCMIVVSMSILSMIIFACGDSGDHKSEKKHRRNNHAVAFGGIAGAASSGGGGGGCGGGGGGGGGAGGGGGMQKAPYQSAQGSQGESDPNNTTIFVGGLDPSVSDETLRGVFGQFGELIHVKIPVGKRCGFVQFANRGCAEQALSILNGTELGGQNIRLSWGRSPSSKQGQSEQPHYGGGGGGGGGGAYYGYAQGYEAYGYAPPPQDPNAYYGVYAGAAGYGGYQQPQQ